MSRVHCDRCQPGAFRSSGQETWCVACMRAVIAGENPHSYIAPLTLDWYASDGVSIDTARVRPFGYDAKQRDGAALTARPVVNDLMRGVHVDIVANESPAMQQTSKRGAA